MSEEVKILKVRFDKTTLTEASDQAIRWAKAEDQKHITTPNPEILLEAQQNPKFQKILNKADLNIADGIGILWAAKYLQITEHSKSKWLKRLKWFYSLMSIALKPSYIRTVLPERVTGVDLMQKICKKAAENELKVFLLGAAEGVAEQVKDKLESKYPKLEIADTHAGSPSEQEAKAIIHKINSSEAQILFVAYGAPAQELWINHNLHKMPEVKVSIGVGGAFDFIAGVQKRAPKWLQTLGLEWLYRLIKEPSRRKRIYNATVKFPLLILKISINQKPLRQRISTWLAEN